MCVREVSKRTISAHAGRWEKTERPRNDPPLGDERPMKLSSQHESKACRCENVCVTVVFQTDV